MKSEEQIRTVVKVLEEYFEYPGIKEPIDDKAAATKYDMQIVCDTLKWVLGNSDLTGRILDGLIELDEKMQEITECE